MMQEYNTHTYTYTCGYGYSFTERVEDRNKKRDGVREKMNTLEERKKENKNLSEICV